MVNDKRKKQLMKMFENVIDPLGYKFSPDKEIVDFLMDQEIQIEKETGHPYCPCQGLTGSRDIDMKIVCPCIPFNRAYFDMMKRCWCGLYVHKDVDNPDTLVQISRSDFEKAQKEKKI